MSTYARTMTLTWPRPSLTPPRICRHNQQQQQHPYIGTPWSIAAWTVEENPRPKYQWTVPRTTQTNMFLDLPLPVRHSIYELAGVMIGGSIGLAPGGQKWKPFILLLEDDVTSWESPFQSVLELLLVCKTIQDEVLTMVLSENTLVIGPDAPSITCGLKYIANLPSKYCFHVRSLSVTLQRFTGPHDDRSWRIPKYPTENRLTTEVVAAWEQAATHLLEHVRPKQLSLRLICDKATAPFVAEGDCSDDSLPVDILRPFLQHQGKLADLELRLAATRNRELSALALKTVCHATGRQDAFQRQGTFRFLDLPQEIRRHILEYTDLVTPCRKVEWSSQTGYSYNFPTMECMGHEPPHGADTAMHFWMDMGPARWHYGCAFRFCETRRPCGDRILSPCCRARHSAYKASCQCWTSPSDLMLVSRAVFKDAQAVFFSKNRISILPSHRPVFCTDPADEEPTPHRPSLRLDASKFVTMHTWPEAALPNLRHLEVVVWPFEEPFYYNMCSQTYLDWTFAVQHLATHANTGNLTLSVYLSRAPPIRELCNDLECYKKSLYISAKAYDQWLFAAYERFLAPLRSLAPMKRFFVHLEAVWEPNWNKELAHRIRDSEARLERLVQGPEYDGAAEGKFQEEIPQWRGALWMAGNPDPIREDRKKTAPMFSLVCH